MKKSLTLFILSFSLGLLSLSFMAYADIDNSTDSGATTVTPTDNPVDNTTTDNPVDTGATTGAPTDSPADNTATDTPTDSGTGNPADNTTNSP
jgi:hypothetical protein